MSASLPALLASELDTSVEQARKLLTAMLREVRKRARREGVRLPDFGTFREQNGRLTFEPSPSLARAVNHRFEGLGSEDLATAQPNESEQPNDDDGPSTITLGYQNSDWSPLDSSEPDESDSDDEADTEEFQIPSADDGPDTEEFQTPPSTPDASRSPDRSSSDSTRTQSPDPNVSESPETKTEDLYPIVDESSNTGQSDADSKAEQQRVVDAERSALSGIWRSDSEIDNVEEELDQFAPDSDPAPQDEASSASAAPEETPDPPSDVQPVSEASEPDAPPSEPTPSPSSDRSSFSRVLVGLLVLLLFGGAGWYILGQQGTVQTPRATFSQLQLHVQDVPLFGATSEDASSEEAGPDASDEEAQSAEEASESASSSSAEPAAEGTASSDDRDASAQEITPADGGWSIVVGSRTDRTAAESLEKRYRDVFLDRGFPVGILEGQADNATRYRVAIGQFQSQDAARAFLEEFDEDLPDGAWILEI